MFRFFNISRYAALCFFLFALSVPVQAEHWAMVQKAVDGDTLRLQDGRVVRLIGIDAPEIDHENGMHEPLALEARQFLSALANGKRVRLEMDQSAQDSYGRVLAYLFDSKGRMLNQQIVANGFAHVFYLYPDIKAYAVILKAQRQAMAANEGKWRHFHWEQGPFVANRASKRFHRPDCPSALEIGSENRVRFSIERDAFWEGYAPCRQCLSGLKKKS